MNYNQVPAPHPSITNNNFSTLMIDFCAAPELVFCAHCAPCWLVGKTAKKFDKLESCWNPCIIDCLVCSFLPCYACFYRAKLRKRVRERYGIVGNDTRDCCIFNPCCGFPSMALVQQHREIELREETMTLNKVEPLNAHIN